MEPTFDAKAMEALLGRLAEGDLHEAAVVPGRQPVHTVYGGAQLFSRGTLTKLAAAARSTLSTYAPTASDLSHALGLPVGRVHAVLGSEALAESVHRRVAAKLEHEAIEDFRIDFEDGFGVRSDADEDEIAVRAASELALAGAAGALPPFIGVRIKPLAVRTRARALRTLDLFLSTLARAGPLPSNFVVTLPKVESAVHVAVLGDALEALERSLEVPVGSVKVEVMVELTRTLFGPRGELVTPSLAPAARGRLRGAHFGTYDYTASAGVTAVDQRMGHPVADFARAMMQACLAGTGVWLSDGATLAMPLGPHRGGPLSPAQAAENRSAVHAAWRASYEDISHSLKLGFFQGWDLHPAQLPARFAAVYAYFVRSFGDMAARLHHFLDQAARATQLRGQFDDAATGQGLLTFFLRGVACGALTEAEVTRGTGLTPEELGVRDFSDLVARRAR